MRRGHGLILLISALGREQSQEEHAMSKSRTIHLTLIGKSRACGAARGDVSPHCTAVTCKACLKTKAWKASVISYKPEFCIDGIWYDNAVRFATHEEAEQNAREKFLVWTMPTAYRVSPSEDRPNYRQTATGIEAIEPAA